MVIYLISFNLFSFNFFFVMFSFPCRQKKLYVLAIGKRFSILLLIIINLNFSAAKIKFDDSLGQGVVSPGTKCGVGKVTKD